MTTRTFHIGDVIAAATGRFCTPNGMDGIYSILNWMTGDNLMTHQLPRASREGEGDLRRQHPDLANLDVPQFVSRDEGMAWLAEQVARFGETREVAPLPVRDHTSIDPIAEMKMMAPNAEIVEVGL